MPEPTNKAASNSPLSLTSVDESLQRGEQELGRGNYQLAQTHFDDVLKKQPDHAQAHHRLGVLADKLNQFEQAEQHYLSALNGDPENAALLSDLGYSYFMQGRYADGERYLLKARKLDPNYQTAVANLGLLYASTGRQQEAVAMLRQIGDEAQVDAIMQQVAGGRFAPMQPPKDNPFATSTANVAATVATVESDAEFPAQEMSKAARDFVEQMRKAKEAPNWSEQQHAHVQQSRGAMPVQHGNQQQVAQPQRGWAQQGAMAANSAQQPPPYSPNAGYPNQQPQAGSQNGSIPASALSGAMTAIDHHDQRGPSNSPIVFGRPEAANSPAAGQLEQASWSSQPNAATSSVVDNTGAEQLPMQVVPNSRQTNQAYANSSQPPATQGPIQQPENSGSYWDQRRASQAGEMAAQNASSQSVGGAGTANLPADGEPQMTISPGPPASVPMAPGQVMWQGEPSHPGTIQQLNGNAGPYPQPSVEQAYHTQQNDQASNITLAGQSSAPQGPISQPTSTNPAAGGGSTAGGWSYEQGRREAALLGMSAGPGQVFPYVRQTQQPLTGTDWRTNGSPSSSPAQYQPSGVRPTDFNAMIQNPQVVPAATNGSQPSSIQQGNAPANAGAPTNAVHSQQQYFQHRPTQQSTGDFYQNAAAQQSNQAWGQMPQPSHFGVTPSSSNPYQGSATNFAPPTANVTPAPYYQRADASPAGQTQQAGYQQTAPYGVVPAAVSWDGAVNPEQYRKATRPNVDSQTLPVIQGRPSNMAPANSPSYTSPMIVPNQR